MKYVCDFSFLFDAEGKKIIKEASVVSVYTNSVGHWITSPPYLFRTLNLQLRRKNNKETLQQHHLHWNDGETELIELQDHLVQLLFDSTRIFVHGQVKHDILKKLLPNHNNIINLAAFNCPLIRMFSNKQLSCVFHGAYARNTDSSVH